LLLLLSLALSACMGTKPQAFVPLEVPPPQLPPPPADVMVPETEDFQQEILDFFSLSAVAATPSGTSSAPASK
jgi:hypothetical protein